MGRKTGYVGGFVSQNDGNIRDCYSLIKFAGKEYLSGGFAGANKGSISTSYCTNKLKGLTGGFSAAGNSKTKYCYFFHNEKQGAKALGALWDWVLGQRASEIGSSEDIKELGFDTEGVWEYEEKTGVLRFIEDKWMYDAEPSEAEVITIRNAEELIEFEKRLNGGERTLCNAKVKLVSDIDLGGKEWTPIGNTRTLAFCGVFDGGGHTVRNYVIKNKSTDNKGFFGFLKGEVYNLTVDCIIKGTGCCGGLAAQNIGGTIGCCAALVNIKGGSKNAAIGGLVGINSGEIFQSYTAGHYAFVFIPFLPIGIGAGTLALVYTIFFILLPNMKSTPIYQPLPDDPQQVPIPGDKEVQKEGTNFISFQFEKEIVVNLETGTCTLNFKNPGSSNHNVVVHLQLTDEQANAYMGGTGRSAEKQAEYEAREDYDPKAFRVTIAQSDSIKPGYQIDALLLTDFARENLKKGVYDAIVYLVPYDVVTNGRAMLESQLPVTIKVH